MKNFVSVRDARESKKVLNSGFHALDSGFQVLSFSLCEWNLDSGFQSLVGIRMPWAVFRRFRNQQSWISQLAKFFWIPDSTSELKISRIPGVPVLLAFACVPMYNLKLILINSRMVPRRFRLGHSWTLPWAAPSPRDTGRERRSLDPSSSLSDFARTTDQERAPRN